MSLSLPDYIALKNVMGRIEERVEKFEEYPEEFENIDKNEILSMIKDTNKDLFTLAGLMFKKRSSL